MEELVAQGIGIVAMFFNIFSYQMRTSRGVVLMQLVGGALFSVNYFMIGASVGAMLNLLVTLRAIVYSNREKFGADSLFWIALFSLLFVSTYVLSFTVPIFNTEWNLPNAVFGILPVFAMILVTWSFRANKASVIRRLSLISCPCWLIYNIFSFNIGAIICDSVSLISAVVGIFRYDIKKTADKT